MKRKVISVILLMLLTFTLVQSSCYATALGTPVAPAGAGSTAGTGGTTETGGTAGGSKFDWNSKKTEIMTSEGDSNVTKPINSIAGTLITVTQIIAMGVAIIMLIVLAMKYMMAAPGDKATIKNHAVVYIVGAITMFACTGILGIIKQFARVLGN